jgi:hypothetical protein
MHLQTSKLLWIFNTNTGRAVVEMNTYSPLLSETKDPDHDHPLPTVRQAALSHQDTVSQW